MSGQQRQGEKTEKPTSKRLRDSRKKGDVAKSKDFGKALLVLTLLGFLAFGSVGFVTRLAAMLVVPSALLALPFDEVIGDLSRHLLLEAVSLFAPFVLAVFVVGILGEALQIGILVAPEKLKPQLKAINPIENLKNLFSIRKLAEFIKSVLILATLSAVAYVQIMDAIPALLQLPYGGFSAVGIGAGRLLIRILMICAFAFLLISMVDLIWQHYQHHKQLRMTRKEVEDEYKEMEGDPHIKSKRKELHRDMLMTSMVDRAREATVLVTNPTHVAIGLYYDQGDTPLPVVVAKGTDWIARLMIEAAREAGVPVVENATLARALLADTPLDQFIPGELIVPVAEVIGIALRIVRDAEAVSSEEKNKLGKLA